MKNNLGMIIALGSVLFSVAHCGDGEGQGRTADGTSSGSEGDSSGDPTATGGSSGESTGDGDGDESPLEDPQQGDPDIRSIHEIEFGPAGVLVIGDGVGDQLVAIETGDTNPDDAEGNAFESIDGIGAKLAAIFAGPNVTIEDLAINPISKRLYVAAFQASTNAYAIVTFDGDGNAFMVDLDDVTYVSVQYPPMDTPGSIVSDLRWADGHLVASAMKGGFTPSQLVVVPNAPLTHGASSEVTTTNSYHRSHMAWETQAPISRFAAYSHEGEAYIAASFQCTPVVRYKVEDIAPGVAMAIGETPYDLGGGKQVEDFVWVEKPDHAGSFMVQILSGVAGQIGVASGLNLVAQTDSLDEVAPVVLNGAVSAHAEVVRVTGIDGASRVTAFDDTKVVILRGDAIETITLPF